MIDRLYIGILIGTYVTVAIIISGYRIKNSSSESSPLGIVFTSALWIIAYPIKFLFDMGDN